MKYALFFFLVFALAANLTAAPLIFKTTKVIKSDGDRFQELATVDVSKYKSVRVGVKVSGAEFGGSPIRIEAVEGGEAVVIDSFTVHGNTSVVIENLPPKIRISASDTGTYKLFVWASQ